MKETLMICACCRLAQVPQEQACSTVAQVRAHYESRYRGFVEPKPAPAKKKTVKSSVKS